MSEAEVSLHEKFRSQRLRGEWFALSGSDISDAITLCGDTGGDTGYHPRGNRKPRALTRPESVSESSSLSFPAEEKKGASFDFPAIFAEMYGVWKKKAGRQLAQQALAERLRETNGDQAEFAHQIRDKALAFAASESMVECPVLKWPKLEDWIRDRRDEDDAQPPEQEDGW